MYWHHVDMP
jgi:hypothetical protein